MTAIATSQTNFRAHMKDYMDSVVKENSPVYIVRGNDSFVLESQENYKLLLDYAKASSGSLNKALLEEKMIDAGFLPQPKAYDNVDKMMQAILGDDYGLEEAANAAQA